MNVNDIVYSSQGGFGIVIKTDTLPTRAVMCTVIFSDGSVSPLAEAHLVKIPPLLVDALHGLSIFSRFTDTVVNSGHKLMDSVEPERFSVRASPFSITAAYQETVARFVSIRVKGKEISFACDCAHAPNCRHAVALLLYLQDIILELDRYKTGGTGGKTANGKPANEDDDGTGAEQSGSGTKKKGTGAAGAENAKNGTGTAADSQTSLALPDSSARREKALQKAIDTLVKCKEAPQIVILALLESLAPPADQQEISTVLERLYTARCKYRDTPDEMLRALVFCDRTEPALDALMNSRWRLSVSLASKVKLFKTAKRPGRHDWDIDRNAGEILTAFYNNRYLEAMKALLRVNSGYSYGPVILEFMTQIMMTRPFEDRVKYYAELCRPNLHLEYREQAISSASSLPESDYFLAFLKNNNGTNVSDYSKAEVTDEEIEAVDADKLNRYFACAWEIKEYKEQPALVAQLTVRGTDVIALTVTETAKGTVIIGLNAIEKRAQSPIGALILRSLHGMHGEEIDSKLADLKAKIDKRKQEERIRALTDKLNGFTGLLPATVLQLEESARADLEFIVTRSTGYNSTYWMIEMRIGTTKKFVVKDALELLERFRTGATFQYGKTFTFTHLMANIRPEKREALNFLILYSNGASGYRNERFLTLDGYVFAAFLQTLRGTAITIEGTSYLVRLNEVKCGVSLTRKCVLHATVKKNEYTVLDLRDRIYLLNKEENAIDEIPGTAEQLRLYSFAINNDGENLEPVLDRFCENIYSRFYEDINVADELKERVKLSEMEIGAYFDYEAGTIRVRSELSVDGKKVAPEKIRLPLDQSRYRSYLRILESMGFEDNVMKDQGCVLAFLSMDMTGLKKYCKVYLSDSIQNKKLKRFSRQIIQIQRQSNIMEAFLENSEYTDEELKQILTAIRKKKKFVLLKGDRIVDLTSEEAEEFGQTVDDLGLDAAHLSERHEVSMPQALRSFAHESGCRIDEYLYKMISEIRGFKNARIPLPPLKAKLRPYQEEGFRWLRTLADYHVGGILADDMGLGKTLEFITLLKSDPYPGPDLVVCPKSLVFNWVNEFRRFSPDTEVKEIYGTPSARREIIAGITAEDRVVYVTSYDSLRNDLESYEVMFRYLILDEAQYIKNVKAMKSQSVKLIRAEHRFALTGTPIENSVLDLWSIFDFIMPGYFDEITTFKAMYSRDSRYTSQIARRIAPFVLRRTKQDVLTDLPDKYERILTVEMQKEQRKYYDAYRKEAADALKSGANAFQVLPYLMRLRQICDAPGMFLDSYTGGSAKLDAVKEIIRNYTEEGHRILLFSQFVQALEQIEAMLKDMNMDYYKITGDTSARERIRQMNEFNDTNEVNVFLISLKAGGTGLNLTGADTVIHLDPWWNTAAENQATDRAHRIGQTRNVEVIKLICEESVEERIIELQEMKKDIIDQIISDNDQSVTGITLEDISFILK